MFVSNRPRTNKNDNEANQDESMNENSEEELTVFDEYAFTYRSNLESSTSEWLPCLGTGYT